MLTRFKEKYIGDAAFYKRYLYLALPMILQNAITNRAYDKQVINFDIGY